jgi:ribonuclease HI
VTCANCGDTFTISATIQERYPGWTPSLCANCHKNGGKNGAKNGSKAASGARAATTRAPNQGVADVLSRFTDGPDTGVFTDGSAQPNPGPGGWGAVYVKNGTIIAQRYGHVPATTNNRMELQALLAATELVPVGEPAVIHTDSKLAVDTVNTWAASWEKRGWKRKNGPVENLDLVKPLFETFRSRPELSLQWIAAHVGYRWNEYADALATAWTRETL